MKDCTNPNHAVFIRNGVLCDCATDERDVETCSHHGEQAVSEYHEFTGHAGGRCYAALLACGCFLLDETADHRAAI